MLQYIHTLLLLHNIMCKNFTKLANLILDRCDVNRKGRFRFNGCDKLHMLNGKISCDWEFECEIHCGIRKLFLKILLAKCSWELETPIENGVGQLKSEQQGEKVRLNICTYKIIKHYLLTMELEFLRKNTNKFSKRIHHSQFLEIFVAILLEQKKIL